MTPYRNKTTSWHEAALTWFSRPFLEGHLVASCTFTDVAIQKICGGAAGARHGLLYSNV